ncbi:Berardinelli-Seip congenital lipodystrophy 2 (seipin) [Phytophthora boehmeriae]|uniref:Berardinelli-Seip congenital lipodystrophy 2 (Seipin) n=1 Tax=Phytophthora boehmeriae TaxID=109152 RepID=A0A8T1WT77_9STRA|nr:Berardinelli-Seip congenital lipodystrophy 2 (seipin) [Phytophthora boehmeriae]
MVMMAAWVPWTLLLAFLPSSATDLLQDEEQRQRLYEELQRMAKEYSKLLLFWSFRALQVFIGVAFLFTTATVLYAMLYYLVIPSRFHEQEIFLNYGQRHGQITNPPNADIPTASLNLLDPVHQWQTATPKFDPPTQPVLVPGVRYDVIVELTVPESQANVDVGVFMVTTKLYSTENNWEVSSARPVTLHHVPTPVRWLRLGTWLVPYALGFTEPAQTLSVTAINGYPESSDRPITRVDIELNTPKMQVYSAKLTIIAQLTGVRYLMYHWSVPTAMLFILNIAFVETLALVILYAFYALPRLDEEAAGDIAVLEAEAAQAREKAKELLEPGSSPSATNKADVKSEEVINEVFITSASPDEAKEALGTSVGATDDMDVKKEPVDSL